MARVSFLILSGLLILSHLALVNARPNIPEMSEVRKQTIRLLSSILVLSRKSGRDEKQQAAALNSIDGLGKILVLVGCEFRIHSILSANIFST